LNDIKSNKSAGHNRKAGTSQTNGRNNEIDSTLGNLEKRLRIVEGLLLSADISEDVKVSIVDALKERDIVDDVQTNKEDIISLFMNDGRHDLLISDSMAMTNYVNNTIIPALDHTINNKIDVNVAELHQHDDYIDSTRPPLGSIVAWLPAYSAKAEIPSGWQRCDGSEITQGPLKGMATPELNASKRFLRGAADEQAGSMEEDAVQDHQHADPGHTHQDNGHSHVDAGHTHYEDSSGDGHFPLFVGSDEAHHEDLACTRYQGDGNCGGYYVKFNAWTVENGQSNIQGAKAAIQASTTGIGGMSTGTAGGETKPKNMNVVYIIRIL